MIDLLRGELIKLRTTRTALGFALAALLLGLALSLLGAGLGHPSTDGDVRTTLSSSGLVFVVTLIYGVVGSTGEFRHRTITGSLLISPDRIRVLVAKLIAYFISGALLALVLQVVSLGVGSLLLDSGAPGVTGAMWRDLVVGGTIACGLGAALGVAVGQLIRNQVAAIIGTILFVLAIEPAVSALWDPVTRYTIGATASALEGVASDHHFSGPVSGLVLFAWLALFGGLSMALDRRRDIS